MRGPEAATYLNRMVSNEVEELAPGDACEALLLTARARVIATMTVFRRSAEDFLLLTEPELGVPVRAALLRARFAAKCEIEAEEHRSLLLLGADSELVANQHELGVPNRDYGVPAVELIDTDLSAAADPVEADELERLRILAGTPRFGREIDDRVLPAEAGLDRRAISFTKGCYPGQEPVARLHYRGHPNRTLRVLAIDGDELPPYDAELSLDGKVVGRVTSAARDPGRGIVALAYVRREVAADAALTVDGGGTARTCPV